MCAKGHKSARQTTEHGSKSTNCSAVTEAAHFIWRVFASYGYVCCPAAHVDEYYRQPPICQKECLCWNSYDINYRMFPSDTHSPT
eukprot:6212653-Pleurochrysis_carterae.AAC.1